MTPDRVASHMRLLGTPEFAAAYKAYSAVGEVRRRLPFRFEEALFTLRLDLTVNPGPQRLVVDHAILPRHT